MKVELHPTMNRLWGGRSRVWMTQHPMNWIVFWCEQFERQQMGKICTYLENVLPD